MTSEPNIDLDSVRVLIDQARGGDEGAHSALAQHVQNYLTIMADRKLEKVVRSNLGPSDIVQQTLIQMVNGIEDFRGKTTREFYGWLNQIINNEAAKAGRNLKRQKRDVRRQQRFAEADSRTRDLHEPADHHPTPGSNAVSNERIELFHKALQRLPDDYATVIRLRSLDQLPFKEIAERMNRPVESVSKLWYRAILKFQKEIDQLDDITRQ